MGLFSTIGALFGPVGTAFGAVGDGLFKIKGDREAAKNANAAEMWKYARLRKAAERGGFHPLEVLRAGGSVDYTPRPSLMTSLASSNAFDALEDELTGEGAKARRREDVQDEIQQRVLENMRYDVAQRQITRPTNVTNRPPRVVGTGAGSPPHARSSDDGGYDGSYDEQMAPPGVTTTYPDEAEARPLLEPMIMPDGTVVYVPEDIGQAGLGVLSYSLRRMGDAIGQQHQEGLKNSTKADVDKVREQVRKNNPTFTSAEVEKAVKAITGEYYQ